MTPKEFINKYSNEIVQATNGTPLFPSVKMAQAALETGWGKNTIRDGNNMFGIKAYGAHSPYWKGNYVETPTTEVYNGIPTIINDKFRSYNTLTDSIRDHSYLLMTLSRYAPVRNAKTPEEQARALQSSGYATDSIYANKLINLINQYNLKELDKKKVQ